MQRKFCYLCVLSLCSSDQLGGHCSFFFLSTCFNCRTWDTFLRWDICRQNHVQGSVSLLGAKVTSKLLWGALETIFYQLKLFGSALFVCLFLWFVFPHAEIMYSHRITNTCSKKCRNIELFRNGFEEEGDFLLQTG